MGDDPLSTERTVRALSGHPLPDDFTGRGPYESEPGTEGPGAVGANRPIRCPACRREHLYEPPALPCPCGASLKVPLLRGGVPVQVRFRSWEDSWLSMRCPHCGRSDQWPQPEFTCNCGATVRLPVDRAPRTGTSGPQGARPYGTRPHVGSPAPLYAAEPPAARPPHPGADRATPQGGRRQNRPPFRPQPLHTSQDAVLTTARYLEWLGFEELELSEAEEREAVTLLGDRLVAQVDTWSEPADVRVVECLWLQTLHAEEMAAAMFTMAGYSHQATVRGEQLLVALFTLDQSGLPQPANGAAEALLETGWTS
ncbi:hypothetical protein P3T36_005357 [Kitasatospora sp. MAP12-15]|uniref:hypothetical protein n=1 Tax=unclassified Kitasatospora TaxID=2633591 RepID=UPI002473ABB8|nr:hypothetical protein [Kitasatospora sp. MAP12-44]MDH6109842.1 hypothetical protein [Kitasatospora sp. MAP12-44]